MIIKAIEKQIILLFCRKLLFYIYKFDFDVWEKY